MVYDIDNLPQYINIGASGTNRQRIIAFDVSKWVEKWPTATFNVCVLRPYDSQINVYIGDSELDGNTLYWVVHYADTQFAGQGWMEIHATISGEDNLFAKSKRVVIAIDESVCDTAGEAPEPSEPWVARVEAAAQAAIEAAEGFVIDTTLTHSGQSADAKATGDAIAAVRAVLA